MGRSIGRVFGPVVIATDIEVRGGGVGRVVDSENDGFSGVFQLRDQPLVLRSLSEAGELLGIVEDAAVGTVGVESQERGEWSLKTPVVIGLDHGGACAAGVMSPRGGPMGGVRAEVFEEVMDCGLLIVGGQFSVVISGNGDDRFSVIGRRAKKLFVIQADLVEAVGVGLVSVGDVTEMIEEGGNRLGGNRSGDRGGGRAGAAGAADHMESHFAGGLDLGVSGGVNVPEGED